MENPHFCCYSHIPPKLPNRPHSSFFNSRRGLLGRGTHGGREKKRERGIVCVCVCVCAVKQAVCASTLYLRACTHPTAPSRSSGKDHSYIAAAEEVGTGTGDGYCTTLHSTLRARRARTRVRRAEGARYRAACTTRCAENLHGR